MFIYFRLLIKWLKLSLPFRAFLEYCMIWRQSLRRQQSGNKLKVLGLKESDLRTLTDTELYHWPDSMERLYNYGLSVVVQSLHGSISFVKKPSTRE